MISDTFRCFETSVDMTHLGECVKGNVVESDIIEDSNLWLDVLNETQESSSNKLPAFKNLLVLGDNESGKTSMIAKLEGSEDPRKGCGLEYHILSVRDDDRDEHTRLSVYVLDGDPWHRNLLKFVLNEKTFSNTTVLITASMSKPSEIMDSLRNWSQILEEHIQRLRLPETVLEEYRKKVQRRFEEYVEPGEADNVTGSRIGESESEHRIEINLGLDIIVVITKTDVMANLEKEEYKDEHFDFIQYSIRNFCLQYGAALVYISVKDDKNCNLLLKYLVHKIYSQSLQSPPRVVEKDAIFIPAGWDSAKKITILVDQMQTIKHDDPYNEVIVKPVNRKPLQRDTETTSEDDLVFLFRLQSLLNQQIPATVGRPVSSQETPIRTSAGVQKTADRRLSGSPGVQASPKKIEGKHGTVGGEGVLQNFFNSLLNRRTGSPIAGPSVRSLADKSTARLDAAVELDRMSGFKKGVGLSQSLEPPFGGDSDDNSAKNMGPS